LQVQNGVLRVGERLRSKRTRLGPNDPGVGFRVGLTPDRVRVWRVVGFVVRRLERRQRLAGALLEHPADLALALACDLRKYRLERLAVVAFLDQRGRLATAVVAG
jgi:hypothetical protein